MNIANDLSFFIFYFFIKCMQSMTMTLSRRCMYAKLHVFFFKFYVLMKSKTMKHDAIYLNSSTEALCIC